MDIYMLKEGHMVHYKKINEMKLKKIDRSIIKNDKEVTDILYDHFKKLYNHNIVIDQIFIKKIKTYDSIQYKVIDETLKIFIIPDDIRLWMRKLYLNYVIKLKVM